MTAIFTPAQALLAAKAGASYVAPYVNKLDTILADGNGVVAEIVEQFDLFNLDCKVLAASFRNAEQVNNCALCGCHCVTVSPEVMKMLPAHPMTDVVVAKFNSDWQTTYGNKSILDM